MMCLGDTCFHMLQSCVLLCFTGAYGKNVRHVADLASMFEGRRAYIGETGREGSQLLPPCVNTIFEINGLCPFNVSLSQS